MKILITGGKNAVALKLIKAFDKDEVIIADYDEMPSLNSKKYKLISLGEKNIDTTAHTLLNNCLNESADIILPLQQFEIEAIAKSAILFSEFGIRVLLPEIDKLNQYLNMEETVKENWIIFNSGESIFYSLKNDAVMKLGETEKLSGAYYFNNTINPTLELITI